MRQRPLNVLDHSQHSFRQRTTQADLDEIEDWTDRAARRMYEGAGLGPEDVDIQSLRLLCTDGAVLPGGPSGGTASNAAMPPRSTPRYQGRGTAPVLLERRQFGERAHPYGHVHRQHRAAPRHGRRPAGHGSGRDCAGGIHHAKQRRLDHVRQISELTACDNNAGRDDGAGRAAGGERLISNRSADLRCASSSDAFAPIRAITRTAQIFRTGLGRTRRPLQLMPVD